MVLVCIELHKEEVEHNVKFSTTAEELEYVLQRRVSTYDARRRYEISSLLSISEIQRRTLLENMVMQPKPNTTVAQEVVSEFAQPQGLAGMPQGMSQDISLPLLPNCI